MIKNVRDDLPVAIVIGGSGGMGQACARRLAERHTVVLANRDVSKSQAVADDLEREGGAGVAIACDVTDPASVAEMVRQSAELGPVTVLACVAGLSPSMADGRRIMTVNLVGTATVVESVLPIIAPGGAAVLVTSIAGHRVDAWPELLAALDDPLSATFQADLEAAVGHELSGLEAYRYSKLGEIRMARRLVTRFAEKRSRIVSLTPGIIATPMGAMEFENSPGKKALFQLTPVARQGMLTEICDALEFLVSDRASFITGIDLNVDGGLTAAVEFGLAAPQFG